MIRLFLVTTALVLSALWQGWFTTIARSSTDFLFTKQGGYEPTILVVGIDDASLTAIGRWPWPRATQAQLLTHIAKIGPTVIGYDVTTDDPVPGEPAGILAQVFADFPFIVRPGKTAHVTVTTDRDGIVRSLPCADSFALAIARLVTPIRCSTRELLINYAFDESGVAYVSARDVLAGAAVPKRPIVLVGVTSPYLQDTWQTPLSAVPLPGVIVQANAVATIRAPAPLSRLDVPARLTMTVFTLIVFFLGLRVTQYAWGLLWLLLTLVLVMLGTIFLFHRGILTDFFYLPTGLGITYASQLVYGYWEQYRKRVFITRAFGRYISPLVVDQLVKAPETLRLGGTKRELTMLFADIRAFTTIAERMDPDALVALLNRYLSFATGVIHRHGGTIDKFVGDAVVAFWNAPLASPGHARRAAVAAWELERGAVQLDGIRVGIGLHTDTVLVGNIGAEDRLNYTMIGDGVNTTARLEGLTKLYGVPIVVSEAFVRAAQQSLENPAVLFRRLDRVHVKGKATALTIYELVGPEATVSPATRTIIARYERALTHYHRGAWSHAETLARRILAKHDDPPSRFLLQRVRKPKPKHWGGVFTLTHK